MQTVPHPTHARLKPGSYLRAADLVGVKAITPEQAEANRSKANGRNLRPRDGVPGVLPFSAPTLWAKVRHGAFPKPVKLSAGVTAWRAEDVAAWLQAKEEAAGVGGSK